MSIDESNSNGHIVVVVEQSAPQVLMDFAKFLLPLLITAQWNCLLFYVQTQAAPGTRIVGGTTTMIASAPFMVNIRANGLFICGGALVSERHVVTAAHCIKGLKAHSLIVTGGATFLSDAGTRRSVQRMFVPRGYRAQTMHADVAVLKLSSALEGNNIETIGLCNANWSVGELVQVFGWGQTAEKDLNASNQLRTVMVPLVARVECMRQYRAVNQITSTMFCASAPGTRDACDGDSGGPVIYKNRLCGIVSWGVGCARRQYPGVYTNVRVVEKFIRDAMKQ